ncbi:hypothetical protein D3C87_1673840 [compost metagenome]
MREVCNADQRIESELALGRDGSMLTLHCLFSALGLLLLLLTKCFHLIFGVDAEAKVSISIDSRRRRGLAR